MNNNSTWHYNRAVDQLAGSAMSHVKENCGLVGDLKPLKNIEVYHHVMQGCTPTWNLHIGSTFLRHTTKAWCLGTGARQTIVMAQRWYWPPGRTPDSTVCPGAARCHTRCPPCSVSACKMETIVLFCWLFADKSVKRNCVCLHSTPMWYKDINSRFL